MNNIGRTFGAFCFLFLFFSIPRVYIFVLLTYYLRGEGGVEKKGAYLCMIECVDKQEDK
jgi:hypothetical protein